MLNKILELRNLGKSKRYIADALGISVYKVNKHLNGEYKEESVVESPQAGVEQDRKIKKMSHEIKNLKKKYEVALKEIEDLGKTADLVTFLSDNQVKFNSNEIKDAPKPKANGKNNAVAFMIASDWHVEEEVDPDTINGSNAYNMDIAEARSKKFFENGVTLINQFNQFSNIDTAVLALLGDMISGYIHDELLESNHCSPTEAILFTSKLISWGIEYILKNTKLEKLIIPCSFGNHGRTTQKKRVSTSYKNSFEWLMYKSLQHQYKNNKRVQFIVENGYHTYVNIFDKYLIRFHHGDNIRYGGGVGGLTIPVNKAIAQWNRRIPAYLDVFGHFHQFKDNGNWITNGSLIGYNAFALSIKADFEKPRQTFFLIDEKRGKTIVCPIHVD